MTTMISLIAAGHVLLLLFPVSSCREFSQGNLKVVMCGFSGRFDASSRDAFNKMGDGLIGHSTIVRSQMCDKHIHFLHTWGSQGYLCRLLNSRQCPGSLATMRMSSQCLQLKVTAIQSALRKTNDCATAWLSWSFFFYASRTMVAGQRIPSLLRRRARWPVNMQPGQHL